jgi:hypothetical protein
MPGTGDRWLFLEEPLNQIIVQVPGINQLNYNMRKLLHLVPRRSSRQLLLARIEKPFDSVSISCQLYYL